MTRVSILTGCAVAIASAAWCRAADARPQRPKREMQRPNAAQLLSRFDKNGDGVLDRSECPENMSQRFARIDSNGDSKLDREELDRFARRANPRNRPDNRPNPATKPTDPTPNPPADRAAVDPLFQLLDQNGDGRLTANELELAVKLIERDRNDDGFLQPNEVGATAGRRVGEYVAPAAKGERRTSTLSVGDAAPDFTLPDLAGKREITLSSYRGKRPVVLIFASYT